MVLAFLASSTRELLPQAMDRAVWGLRYPGKNSCHSGKRREAKREGGRSQNNRDMFYMAHFPQTLGTATLSNQGLPLAVLQAGFGPN